MSSTSMSQSSTSNTGDSLSGLPALVANDNRVYNVLSQLSEQQLRLFLLGIVVGLEQPQE